MKRTLKFSDRLLALGEQFRDAGREQEALGVLSKLATFGALPTDVAEETEAHLAEIFRKQRKFKKARRHLQAALAYQPQCARYHFLMASILEEEDNGDIDRLLSHYEQAVEFAPDEPEYHCDFGLFLIDSGDTEEGIGHLRKAVECSEGEFKYVQILALNLMETGMGQEARQTVIAAMFKDADDGRLKKLWDDLRFREALATQERYTTTASRTSIPVILKYRRKKPTVKKQRIETEDGTIIRIDPAESIPQPHTTQRVGKS